MDELPYELTVTLRDLTRAIARCTPGAPPTYAERLWAVLAELKED